MSTSSVPTPISAIFTLASSSSSLSSSLSPPDHELKLPAEPVEARRLLERCRRWRRWAAAMPTALVGPPPSSSSSEPSVGLLSFSCSMRSELERRWRRTVPLWSTSSMPDSAKGRRGVQVQESHDATVVTVGGCYQSTQSRRAGHSSRQCSSMGCQSSTCRRPSHPRRCQSETTRWQCRQQ